MTLSRSTTVQSPVLDTSNEARSRPAADAPEGQRAVIPCWPFLILCAAVAVCVDFGRYHDQHDSDSGATRNVCPIVLLCVIGQA